MDRAAAEAWIRGHVGPAGPIETAHDEDRTWLLLADAGRPWASSAIPRRRGSTLDGEEVARLHRFGPRFEQQRDELAGYGIAETIQHDDLHMMNVYAKGERLRLLDWGDASISHHSLRS